MLLQTTPAAPAAPIRVTVDNAAITNAQEVYQAFRAQRKELSRQLESLEESRDDLTQQLTSQENPPGDVAKKGIEQRLTSVDERITALDKQIADADAQVARAASIPGAAVEPPELPRTGPPEEAFVLGGMFIVIVFLPLSIAFARRIWKRSAQIVTATMPKELTERMHRVEQAVEATAIEVERIGEGQRFMTRIFTENAQPLHAFPSGSPAESTVLQNRPGDVRP